MNLSQVEKGSSIPGTAGTADANTKSITTYKGSVNEEKADTTAKYSGITLVDTTTYYYTTANVRASLAGVNDAMNLSQVEKGSSIPGTAGTADANTKSITTYKGSVNEEKADTTAKYSGVTLVDTTTYYYTTANVRASLAGVNDAMNLSQVEKGSSIPGTAGTADANTKSITTYKGSVNEEKADTTAKYSGVTLVDTTTYYYTTANVRASLAGVNDAMNLSQVEKGSSIPGTAGTADANTKSITTYKGSVNEEKADTTAKYSGITLVDTTTYYYTTANVRASSAGVNDAMNLSQVEKGSNIPGTAGTADANTNSITTYKGSVYEEKADTTAKFSGITLVDTTTYYYTTANVRASSAGVNDAMNLSQVEKGSSIPGTAGTDDANTKSITTYKGSVNEEKADTTAKYSGITLVDTTTYYYT